MSVLTLLKETITQLFNSSPQRELFGGTNLKKITEGKKIKEDTTGH